MSVITRHEHCTICEWLGREAERTASDLGAEDWRSETVEKDGTLHLAIYYAAEKGE